MTNRRAFLAQAGVIGTAMLLKPHATWAKGINNVGLQLYSLRDYLPADPKGVIAKVAKAGYKEVETYGYSQKDGFWGLSTAEFSALLKDNGLVTPSGHYYFNLGGDYAADWKSAIDAAHATGQKYIIQPAIAGEMINTVENCKATAAKFNQLGEELKKEGLVFGYHNHHFEWAPVGNTTFYDILLKETDPALVKLEMDIYWVVRAGKNAAAMLETNPERFRLFHVKDADKNNIELNTEVGKGTVDFKTIFAKAAKAGVKHFIVEQENFTNIDPYVSIAQSSAYVKNHLSI